MSKLNNFSIYGVKDEDADRVHVTLNQILVLEEPSMHFVVENYCEDEDGPYLCKPDFPDYPTLIKVYDIPDWAPIDAVLIDDPRIKATLLERWDEEVDGIDPL